MIWSRPIGAPAPLCAVYELGASVHTLCEGRWYADAAREEATDPPEHQRCGRCSRLIAMVRSAERLSPLDDFTPWAPGDGDEPGEEPESIEVTPADEPEATP